MYYVPLIVENSPFVTPVILGPASSFGRRDREGPRFNIRSPTVPPDLPTAAAYRGAMRIAPSSRITSPLSMWFANMLITRAAYSAGSPSRLG